MSSPRSAYLAALCFSFALGCTARSGGGGGGFIDPDAGSSDDVAVTPGDDVAAASDAGAQDMDAVTPPLDAPKGADVVSPPPDVPVGPGCGNGTCDKGETCTSCPNDCGACPTRCGDGMCNGAETCSDCPVDCGACPTRCGDGMCNGSETCSDCPADCGACPPTCNATACGECAGNPTCGWCRTTNSCVARSGASCADLVTSASSCAVTPTTNITAACNVAMTTGVNDCGFVRVTTYTCTPGSTLTFGCTGGTDAGACGFSGGTCTGDPLMRICAGNTATGCVYAARIQPQNPGLNGVTADDDGCGFCPWVRIACPAEGAVSVFARAYDISMSAAASCAVARM